MLSQFCLSVVCLSVCLWRWCALLSRLKFSAFFSPYDSPGTSFLKPKFAGVGRPFPLKFSFKVINPLWNSEISPISAHSASTVIANKTSSISTYRKLTTRFPTSHTWSVYVTPKSPKRVAQKRDIAVCASKIQLLSKKVSYKVSLCQNFQRQSCSYIIPLFKGP